MAEELKENLRSSPYPEVLTAFDRSVPGLEEELEEFYGEITVRRTGPAAQSFAGPVLEGEASSSRSYVAETGGGETAEFEVAVRDYTQPELEEMLEVTDTDSVEVNVGDAEYSYWRCLSLSYEEGDRTLFDHIGDTVWDLLGEDVLEEGEYEREEDERRFIVEREDIDQIDLL